MDLKLELSKVDENFAKAAPKEVAEVIKRQTEILVQNGIEKTALKVGDTIPYFELENSIGKKVNSKELLSKGPLVISFYRGKWCPYCNLELQAYQEVLPEIKSLGAQLVAISPELPDSSISLTEKYSLEFEVLSDLGNKVAREFGLVYTVEEDLQGVLKGIGVDLVSSHGNSNYELPVPATYVVDSNGKVILSYVNSDHTKRLEPEEAVEALKKLA